MRKMDEQIECAPSGMASPYLGDKVYTGFVGSGLALQTICRITRARFSSPVVRLMELELQDGNLLHRMDGKPQKDSSCQGQGGLPKIWYGVVPG